MHFVLSARLPLRRSRRGGVGACTSIIFFSILGGERLLLSCGFEHWILSTAAMNVIFSDPFSTRPWEGIIDLPGQEGKKGN